MVNSIKEIRIKRSIGIVIEIISFIGCCFNMGSHSNIGFILALVLLFWTFLFIDQWGKEGKTWYKDLDKKIKI